MTDTQISHLRSHLDEVMSVFRMKVMHLLVEELIRAFAKENYRIDEFIFALGSHTDSLVGWEEVTKYLELASEEIAKIQRKNGEETSHE